MNSLPPFTSVTRWLLVVIGCAVLAMAQPMSAADESSTPPPAATVAANPSPAAPPATLSAAPAAVTPAATSATSAATTATPALSAKSDLIIYPKAAAGSSTSSAPNGQAAESSHAYVVMVAFLLAGAGAWVLIQRRKGAPIVARGSRKLNVEETRPLGNRQYLVVADYEGRKFLLGVTTGQIQLLANLDASEEKL